jgi:putative oxidoreductase
MNQPTTNFNRTVGTFVMRVLLGIIFLMQGYGKVFTWGMEGVYKSFEPYEQKLPEFLVRFAAYYTTYVELIGGLLLVLGLFKSYTLYALGLVLLIVSFGHGLSQPIWDLSHVFPRAVLLITLLLIPREWDRWHLDRLVYKKG